jgi:hypothetical protein
MCSCLMFAGSIPVASPASSLMSNHHACMHAALPEDASKCRGATIVFQPLGSLVFFCVGSGEYDELTSARELRLLPLSLQHALQFETLVHVHLSVASPFCPQHSWH